MSLYLFYEKVPRGQDTGGRRDTRLVVLKARELRL